MKIWIDVLTPKQVLFFGLAAKRLSKKHTVICTGRNYRELTNLAKIQRFRLISVGKHGGGEKASKLKHSIARMAKLQTLIEKHKPDLAISLCSPEASRVAYGLGIKHIGFSDMPHATAMMKLAVPLLHKLLIPSLLPKAAFTKFGINAKDIITYRAVDAAIIAKQKIPKNAKLPFDKNEKIILVRVAEDQAAYIKSVNQVDDVIEKLAENITGAKIIVLARYTEQIANLKKKFGKKVKVLTKSYNGKALLVNSDVFIGSGGTMTTEAALLGIPTITYNADPYILEEFLIKKKIAVRETNPDRIARLAQKMLDGKKTVYAKRARAVMSQMQDPITVLEKTIKAIQL